MSAVQRLEAAITKLEGLRNATVESGEVTTETVVVSVQMFAPVLRILRNDLRLFKDMTPEQEAKVLDAFHRAGDSALVDAILGDAS